MRPWSLSTPATGLVNEQCSLMSQRAGHSLIPVMEVPLAPLPPEGQPQSGQLERTHSWRPPPDRRNSLVTSCIPSWLITSRFSPHFSQREELSVDQPLLASSCWGL
ncbi:hypothetical protein ACRRTK_006179 [Alexandromys fortis]